MAGTTGLVLSAAIALPTVVPFLGALAVLGGIGSFLSGVFMRGEEVTKATVEEMEAETAAAQNSELDALKASLEGDNDPRTEELLADLRALIARAKSPDSDLDRLDGKSAFEILWNLEKLFDGSIASLRKTVSLRKEARKSSASKALRLSQKREELVEDVAESVAQMARVLDDVARIGLKPEEKSDLASIRAALDESLEVAKRAEAISQSADMIDLEQFDQEEMTAE